MPRQLSFIWPGKRCILNIFSGDLCRPPRRLAANQSGAVAVTVALMLVPLLGAAGLGAEMGLWYLQQRTMQGAADSAAFSAAAARQAGANNTGYTDEARGIAATYGYTHGTHGVTVAVNSPPTLGNYSSRNDAIEVLINRPQRAFFTALFQPSGPTIAARAVAIQGQDGNTCVLALDKSSVTDVNNVGTTTLNLNNCSLYVNSPNANALRLVGNATINAESAFISGNYSTSGNAQLNTTDGTYTGMPPIADPYADVTMPTPSGCGGGNNLKVTGGKTKNLSPGTYCNGIDVTGNSTINLSPGVYVIDRGALSVAGGSTINAAGGVTIVLTSSTGANYATATFKGGANINLTAPSSGPTAGLAFFQDRNAPTSGSDDFTGGATQNIVGAIYFPHQTVNYAGGTSTGGTKCTQLVAYTIVFKGNADFNTNCAGVGTQNIGSSPTTLVE